MEIDSAYSPRICLIWFIVFSSVFEDGPAACGTDEVPLKCAVPGEELLGGSAVTEDFFGTAVISKLN
jgi:hypothetical protein